MTILTILDYPDPRLRRKAVTVQCFDDSIQKVIDDMFETLYAQTARCAALAATQLDLDPALKITVIDFSEKKNEPLCLVNPKIIAPEGSQIGREGCMSICPGKIFEEVERAYTITVEAQDRKGEPLRFTAEGFLAKCIQHELDHLDGILYLDRLSDFKREELQRQISECQRSVRQNFCKI